MTPQALLATLDRLGVRLTPFPDGTLECDAPKGALTHVLRADLRQHKAALIDLLEAREERRALQEEPSSLPTPRVVPQPPLPALPCTQHDPIFFERQRAGWVCWKCMLLSPTAKKDAI